MLKIQSIRVASPATVSNVGPGFDIMGFALNVTSDIVEISLTKRNEIRIKKITGDGGRLPYDPAANTASAAIISLLRKYEIKQGLDISIHKQIGIGSGLGSSASSAVAGAFGINKLLKLGLSKEDLLEHALDGEILSSGNLHADNVAPCLFGGFTIVRGSGNFEIAGLEYPENLYCSVIYPDIQIITKEARKILGKNVPLKVSVQQAANAAFLVAGLMSKNIELISNSITDLIAEPKRAKLIPCYDDIRQNALDAGALNCNISGSGPSMFAFSTDLKTAKKISAAMNSAAIGKGFNSKSYISKINPKGPRVIK